MPCVMDAEYYLTGIELQQDQPHLYENLTKILAPQEQETLQNVCIEADKHAAEAATAAAELQTNGSHHP